MLLGLTLKLKSSHSLETLGSTRRRQSVVTQKTWIFRYEEISKRPNGFIQTRHSKLVCLNVRSVDHKVTSGTLFAYVYRYIHYSASHWPSSVAFMQKYSRVPIYLFLEYITFRSPVLLTYRQVQHSAILRSAHTVYLCVLCGSQNKQPLFRYTTLTDWFV